MDQGRGTHSLERRKLKEMEWFRYGEASRRTPGARPPPAKERPIEGFVCIGVRENAPPSNGSTTSLRPCRPHRGVITFEYARGYGPAVGRGSNGSGDFREWGFSVLRCSCVHSLGGWEGSKVGKPKYFSRGGQKMAEGAKGGKFCRASRGKAGREEVFWKKKLESGRNPGWRNPFFWGDGIAGLNPSTDVGGI